MNENNGVSLDTSQNTQVPISQESNLPKWYSRFAAYFLDSIIFALIVLIPISILSVVFGSIALLSPSLMNFFQIILSLIISVLFAAAFSYFQHKTGQTWIMKFIGIKLAATSGELLSFKDAFIRNIIIFLPLGLLNAIERILGIPGLSIIYFVVVAASILLDKNNQGFHDKSVNAIYSKVSENTSRSKWILGLSCGCFTILIILLLTVFAAGIGAYMNLGGLNSSKGVTPSNSKNEIKKNYRNEMENKRPSLMNNDSQDDQTIDEVSDEEERMEPVSNTTDSEEVFVKSCMEAAKANPKLDLKDYCECSAKEYMKSNDINSTVNACKSLIKTK